ncbi:LINE-1 reverse transcriptase-like protein [Bienertia sinuspersici]
MLHLLRTRKRGRKFLGILKVDLSKAYDRVRWDFLEKVLASMNFPAVWVGWIMECVTTVRYAILVNGSPTKEFTPNAGLRQGDPISPYLFILCMEALSRRMEALQRESRIKGLPVSRNRERISHLFCADDAVFSFEASPESCNELRNTLEDFCTVSGEMVNYKKSHIQFSRNTPQKFVRYMRKPLRVRSQERMGTYLGCPMEVDGRNTGTFNQIHDRVIQCISSWKYSCLSPAARSILINSILVALAAHIMSVYLLAQKVLKRINSTITKFYWGGNGQTKPIYWKNRDTLELKKEEGGLGLRNLTSLNQALLFRQVWRISKNPHTLASRVIGHKYGKDPLAFARDGKSIRNASWAMRSMVNCARALKSGCGMKIGNGRATQIQEEVWALKELVTFKERAIENQVEKPKFVSDIIVGQSWNVNKIWNLFDRECNSPDSKPELLLKLTCKH